MAKTIAKNVFAKMQDFRRDRLIVGELKLEHLVALDIIPSVSDSSERVGVYTQDDAQLLTRLYNRCAKESDFTKLFKALQFKDPRFDPSAPRTESFTDIYKRATGTEMIGESYKDILDALGDRDFKAKNVSSSDMLQLLSRASYMESRMTETAPMRTVLKNAQTALFDGGTGFVGPQEGDPDKINGMIPEATRNRLTSLGIDVPALTSAIRGASVPAEMNADAETIEYQRTTVNDERLTLTGIENVNMAARQTFSTITAPIVRKALGLEQLAGTRVSIGEGMSSDDRKFVSSLIVREKSEKLSDVISRVSDYGKSLFSAIDTPEMRDLLAKQYEVRLPAHDSVELQSDAYKASLAADVESKMAVIKNSFLERCVQEGAFAATTKEEFLFQVTKISHSEAFLADLKAKEAILDQSLETPVIIPGTNEMTYPANLFINGTIYQLSLPKPPSKLTAEEFSAHIARIAKEDDMFDPKAAKLENLKSSSLPFTENLSSQYGVEHANNAQLFLVDPLLEKNTKPGRYPVDLTRPCLFRHLDTYKLYRQQAAAEFSKYSKGTPYALAVSLNQIRQQQKANDAQRETEQFVSNVKQAVTGIAKGTAFIKKAGEMAESVKDSNSDEAAAIRGQAEAKKGEVEGFEAAFAELAKDPRAKQYAEKLEAEHARQAQQAGKKPEEYESAVGSLAEYIQSEISRQQLEAQKAEEGADIATIEEDIQGVVEDKQAALESIIKLKEFDKEAQAIFEAPVQN